MFSSLAGLCHEQNIYVLIHFSYLPEAIIRNSWKIVQENRCRNKNNDRFRIQDDIRTVTTRKTRKTGSSDKRNTIIGQSTCLPNVDRLALYLSARLLGRSKMRGNCNVYLTEILRSCRIIRFLP